MPHTPHRPLYRPHASPRAVGGRGYHRLPRDQSYGSMQWPGSYGDIANFRWATLAIGLNLPGLAARPVAPLKVCRWPPNAAPHSLGSPRARLTPVTLCTSALSPPHRRSPVQPAPVSPKIAYSAARRALAHGTMCPTHPTGRHIVPTYLLEPTRGGGATVHATFIRMGRVQRLAETG